MNTLSISIKNGMLKGFNLLNLKNRTEFCGNSIKYFFFLCLFLSGCCQKESTLIKAEDVTLSDHSNQGKNIPSMIQTLEPQADLNFLTINKEQDAVKEIPRSRSMNVTKIDKEIEIPKNNKKSLKKTQTAKSLESDTKDVLDLSKTEKNIASKKNNQLRSILPDGQVNVIGTTNGLYTPQETTNIMQDLRTPTTSGKDNTMDVGKKDNQSNGNVKKPTKIELIW